MRHPCNPKVPFPEVRDLISMARAYLLGHVHFSDVCGAATALHDAAHYFAAEPAIQQMAAEWYDAALRVWPEWSPVEHPLTEAQFRSWIQAQLAIFEPADFATDAPPA